MKMQIQEFKKNLKEGMSTTRILLAALAFSLIAVSCNKDENEESFTSEEASINAKIDVINDDASQIIDEQLTVDDGISGKTANVKEKFATACATITRVPVFGTIPTVGSTVTKTIDYGTTGCTMANGNVLKGKIIISFPYQPAATSHTITVTFDNFYHNARKIVGTKVYTRTMTAQTANSPSHPKYVMEMNLTITLSDGRILTRSGSRTSEIIAGYTTLDWNDNEYRITGSWATTFPNTTTLTSTITTPVIVKLSCVPQFSAFSKGIITFARNGRTSTLDFGDGTCDNLAVFTFNGTAFNIVLGN